MGDENQPSKKRAAGRELSRDNPGLDDDDDDVPEQEMGTFKKASDEVIAGRKIVKVRRQQTTTTLTAPSNPFAGIRLVPPTVPSATPANATTETPGEGPDKKDEETNKDEVTSKESKEKPSEANSESNPNPNDQDAAANTAEPNPNDEKEADDSAKKTAESELADEKQADDGEAENNDKKDHENHDGDGDTPLSSFQQHSNTQNAFTGLAGTGFASSAFSFGSIKKDGSPSQSSSLPTFSFGGSNNGTASLFGATGTPLKSEGTAFPPMQEVPRETGEENEETVFSSESALFEFLDGGWKERGKGEVKVNVLKGETGKARLVMRAKGNLRLILNASLYPDMKLTKMDKKGVTFACVNTATEGKDGLSTFALKFKDVSVVEEFSTAVSAHKGKPVTALKTPENSPKASDD